MGTHSRVGCHRVGQKGGFFAAYGYLEIPSLVQWLATLRCGLSCAHCLTVSSEPGFADMPLETVRRLIDEVAALGVPEFLITGGEPLGREDLGEVIEHLGRRGVSWTLNTAAMPDAHLRAVMARHRPGFAAVSLDGPEAVHDAFRGRAGAWEEAREAIRFFKSLPGVRVCAGTTVTRRNYDYLDETFHLVTGSGADQWGIHLLVPEGRAADRLDLFLSKAQLKRLITFVARRRRYFRVEMADEIGYLGYFEPLVREVPLNCGAGRAQCVVLPDGSVVPCTTLDRVCSAGNVHERPLGEIWAAGFRELRAWQPAGRCRRCEYAVACRGGCWLQREAGTHCFKEVWHVAGALKTAAGIAICLGSLAAPNDSAAGMPAASVLPAATAAATPVNLYRTATVQTWRLDDAINTWYVEQAAGLAAGALTPWNASADWGEVAWQFFKDFKEGTLPQDTSECCARVCAALETQERSLSLIALLWRAVNGPLFATESTPGYTERQVIRDTLAAIEQTAEAWRLEIARENLDPYLSTGRRTPPRGPTTKAGPRPGDREREVLSKDLNEERWGIGPNPDTREAVEAWLRDHRYAEQMDLVFRLAPGTSSAWPIGGGTGSTIRNTSDIQTIDVFDLTVTDSGVTLSFTIKGDVKLSPLYSYSHNEESLLNDDTGEQDVSTTLQVRLAARRHYTYTELLNTIYEQYRLRLVAIAYDWLAANMVPLWSQQVPVVAAVYENGALLWPALREIMASDEIIPTDGRGSNTTRVFTPAEISEIHRRAVLKDIDFWMF